MSITTYGELKTAITNWLDRDDLSGRVDEFIDLAEARHARDIRMRQQLVRTSGTTGTTDRLMALTDFSDISSVSDFLAAKRITLEGNPEKRLRHVGPDQIFQYFVDSAGEPDFVTIHDQVEFNRKPDKDYTVNLLFWKRLTALSDSNTSNALLSDHPDAYLFGALTQAAPFLHDERMLQMYEARYQAAVDRIGLEEQEQRWTQGPVSTRPDICTP